MRTIDTDKLSKEMNDALIHRSCVMRSGQYLARYLIHRNRSVDAIRLIGRCSVHDISKIQNMEEFMSLASIVDDIDSMHDITHVLSEEQTNAIKLHWSRNSHHPEYYDNSNDMSDLDLLEMACDCHARSKQFGTDLLDYINIQQDLRFHFDKEHLSKLRAYCCALVELTKNDDYADVLSGDKMLGFDFKDSTMKMLEKFDEECYVECLKTERLYLKKQDTSDFASVGYTINLREDNSEIGYISLKFNGYIEYKVYENYRGHNYGIEALAKFIEITSMSELLVNIKKDAIGTRKVAEELGFSPVQVSENTITFKLKKRSNNG